MDWIYLPEREFLLYDRQWLKSVDSYCTNRLYDLDDSRKWSPLVLEGLRNLNRAIQIVISRLIFALNFATSNFTFGLSYYFVKNFQIIYFIDFHMNIHKYTSIFMQVSKRAKITLRKDDINYFVLAIPNIHENWKFSNLDTVHNARFVLNNYYNYLSYRISSGNFNFFLLAEFVSNITWTKTRSRNDFNCTSSKINVRVSIPKFKINLLIN